MDFIDDEIPILEDTYKLLVPTIKDSSKAIIISSPIGENRFFVDYLRYMYEDLLASDDFKSNPYKYLKHESKYVTEVAKKFIKESND